MSSPALVALRNAIATNTLAASQQAALTDALDLIAPVFPSPDDLSGGFAPSEEAIARQWMAVLYCINAEVIPVPPTPGSGEFIIEPNAAAISAFDTTHLEFGAIGFVQTYGRYFTLDPSSSLALEDGVVLAATPAGRWLSGETGIAPKALTQTVWYLDQGNDTGLASNENDGLTATTPLLTEAEIMRRLGTWSPEWSTSVTIHYLSTTPLGEGNDDVDPSLWTPFFRNGATLTQTADLPAPSFTGTLLAVTPKDIGGGRNALESTFTTTTGAVAPFILLINATRGNSRALASVNLGGGNWRLSQPQSAYDGAVGIPVEDDTWANGDAISGYELVGVGLAKLGGQTIDPPQDTAFEPSRIVTNLRLQNPTGLLQVDCAAAVVVDSCQIEREVAIGGLCGSNSNPVSMFSGCAFENNINSTETSLFVGPLLAGGIINAPAQVTLACIDLGNDIVIESIVTFNNVALNTNAFLAQAAVVEGSFDTAGQIIYGPGEIDIVSGTVVYRGPAATVLNVNDLRIGGANFAYANSTPGSFGNPTTVSLQLLNAGALDNLAVFAGLAYVPGVGAYTNGSTP